MVGTTKAGLELDGRDVGLELRRLVEGDLAGMFDGPTTTGHRPRVRRARRRSLCRLPLRSHRRADGVCLRLVAGHDGAKRGSHDPRGRRGVGDPDRAGRGALSQVILEAGARSNGLANVAVCHRASDLKASGPAGSEQSRLAEGLLADSETVVCYAQPASEVPALAELLGCSHKELEVLPRLRRGVALWMVGRRRYLVEHLLGPDEHAIVDTDARLTGQAIHDDRSVRWRRADPKVNAPASFARGPSFRRPAAKARSSAGSRSTIGSPHGRGCLLGLVVGDLARGRSLGIGEFR